MFLLSSYLALFLWKIFERGQHLTDNSKDGVYEWRTSMRNPNHYLHLLLLKHLLLTGIIVLIILLSKFLATSYCLSSFTYLPLVLGTFLATFITIIKAISFFFSTSSLTSTSPLQLLYSNVRCSPMESFNDNKYYVIFVDHFAKYI